MKQTYKPNFVAAFWADGNHSSRPSVTATAQAIYPEMQSRSPETSGGSPLTLPYLILHHEEFAWPRLLPDAPVSSYLTVSPITAEAAGLFSVALVVA